MPHEAPSTNGPHAAPQAARPAEAAFLPGDGPAAQSQALLQVEDLHVAYGGVHTPAPGLLGVASHAIFDPQTLCRLLSEW